MLPLKLDPVNFEFSEEFGAIMIFPHDHKVFLENAENFEFMPESKACSCKDDNWTKISFQPNLSIFNMEHLEEDVVAKMKKRVFDVADCLGKEVTLNGQQLLVKAFFDYVDLFIRSSKIPRFTEKINSGWKISVGMSHGFFQQVSFVNKIDTTTMGGTHFEYVTNQVVNHVMSVLKKTNKQAGIQAHHVKNQLWVFVNALIDDSTFDPKTGTLITCQSSFQAKGKLSKDLMEKVANSKLMKRLNLWRQLIETNGPEIENPIHGLLDATEARTKKFKECTLILTEGESAKTNAFIGIHAMKASSNYGVFPLNGKPPNVRNERHRKKIIEASTIHRIRDILGLEYNRVYTSVLDIGDC